MSAADTGSGNLTLRYVPADGRGERTTAARLVAHGQHPDPVFRMSLVELEDGSRVVCKRVANVHRPDAETWFQALEDEVWACTRFRRRYGGQCPPELPQVVGYSVDSADPFSLFLPQRGRTLAAGNRGLLVGDQLRTFHNSLFRAVRLVEGAEVVHRNLSPATIRWDGRCVQFEDFTHACLIGERTRWTLHAPWAAPEARLPGGAADPAEDVWSAAMVAYLVARRRDLTPETRPTASDVTDAGLARIADAFVPGPDQRLARAEVLARLGVPDPVPPVMRDPLIEEGIQAFSARRDGKRAARAGSGPADARADVKPPTDTTARGGRR